MVEHRTLSPLNSSPHHIFKIGYKDYLTLPVSTDNKSFNPSQSSFELLAGASRLSDGGRHGVPFTFIHCAADQSIDCNWIEKNLKTWLHVDDVFCHDFLIAVIFVVREGSRIDLAALSRGMQENWGTRWCTVISQQSVPLGNCSGPHVFWKGEIWKAYRLYDDVNETFMTSIRASSNFGSFQALRVSGDFYQSLSVAVPSRIQPPELDNKPLQGIRFAVKDVFEIEGLRVTAGSRAFYSVSKSSRATAPSIQRLIDAGGMLLGTLKLGSLIAREEPSESVDYHAAFNPRGDGYQSAWSSSGGCGAASASYDWIDFTLGTDTTGSSRRPALANGTFQIRLSHNVLSMEGVVASFPPFDAPAMFARNIVNLEDWVSVWIDAAKGSYDKLPISLIYLQDFLPVENKVQMQHVDKFISDFESTYGIKTEKVSLAKIWHAAPPIGADDPCLQSFLKDVGLNSFCYGTYRCFDRFRCEYWERFGKLPYVNPVTRWRWNRARKITSQQHEDGLNRLRIYKKWMLKQVLRVNERNALLVMPITNQEVDYREDAPGPPVAPNAFDSLWLAPILGAPEISLPIGEMKYHSRISQREEYLPVVVSLLGKPGSDMALIDASRRVLERSGRPISVTTGSRMFSTT